MKITELIEEKNDEIIYLRNRVKALELEVEELNKKIQTLGEVAKWNVRGTR